MSPLRSPARELSWTQKRSPADARLPRDARRSPALARCAFCHESGSRESRRSHCPWSSRAATRSVAVAAAAFSKRFAAGCTNVSMAASSAAPTEAFGPLSPAAEEWFGGPISDLPRIRALRDFVRVGAKYCAAVKPGLSADPPDLAVAGPSARGHSRMAWRKSGHQRRWLCPGIQPQCARAGRRARWATSSSSGAAASSSRTRGITSRP
jgi:hypothetical protein